MRTILGLAALTSGLWANPNATLTGRVTDPTGAVIAQVDVRAINVETGIKQSAQTNDEGFYRIQNLLPGTYRVAVEKHGFKVIIRPGVELRVQDIVALNFEMQIGSVSESITVEGGASLIQAETGTLSQVIDRTLMAELPTITRDPYDFVSLSAGAVRGENVNPDNVDNSVPAASRRGIGVSINGQRAESANFALDGNDNTNPMTSTPGNSVPHEAVREYRILTNGFTAEYGRNSGFVANLVTKSGTNDFHGAVYDYTRHSRLSANSFENNANRFPKAVFGRHQFGGSLGGPVTKDRTFLFATVESIRVRSKDTAAYYVPTPQLLAITSPGTLEIFRKYPLPGNLLTDNVVTRTVTPFGGGGPRTLPAFARALRTGPRDAGAGLPQDTYAGTMRMDTALNTRTTLMARYSARDIQQFAPLRQPYSPELDQQVLQRHQAASMTATHIWSPGLVSESRLAFNRYNTLRPEAGPDGFFYNLQITGQDAVLPTGRFAQGGPSNVYQANHSTTWIRGKHQMKFGAQFGHQREAVLGISTGGNGVRARFTDLQGFVDGRLASFQLETDYLAEGRVPGTVIRPPIRKADRHRHNRFNDAAWYFQDTWKLSPRLTLTPGLRWEYAGQPYRIAQERDRQVNFYFGPGSSYPERYANGSFLRALDAPEPYRGHLVRPDWNNFAPRMGLAWDATGNGKLVLRAGAGFFYDGIYRRDQMDFTGIVELGATTLLPGTQLIDDPYAVDFQPRALSTPPLFSRWDADLKIPYTASWNATVEREVKGVVISGSYVGSGGTGFYGLQRENLAGSGRVLGRPAQNLRPGYGAMFAVVNYAHSSYHALQLRAESRLVRRVGLQFGANYTWSHSIDTGSASENEGAGFSTFVQNPERPRLDRASSSFDQRQRFVAYFAWHIPAPPTRFGPAKVLFSRWQASGIVSFQTGQPFHLVDSAVQGSIGPVRPRVTGPLPAVMSPEQMPSDPRLPNRFLYLRANRVRSGSTCIASATPFGCYGSVFDPMDDALPRNIYRRPGSHFQDIAVSRVIPLRERVRLQLRAEFYNILNHANLIATDFAINIPRFDNNSVPGVVARYGGTPRQVVVAARVEF